MFFQRCSKDPFAFAVFHKSEIRPVSLHRKELKHIQMETTTDLTIKNDKLPSIDDILQEQIKLAFVDTCQSRQMANLVFGLVKDKVDKELNEIITGYNIMDDLQKIAGKKHTERNVKKSNETKQNRFYHPYQQKDNKKKIMVKAGKIMMEYTGDISENGELNGDGKMKISEKNNDKINFQDYNTLDVNKILLEFKGSFKKNKFNGYGIAKWKCWNGGQIEYETYEGFWEDSQMKGYGKFTTSKTNYDGFFENNMRHGFGKLITIDGITLEGMWHENWCATPPKRDKNADNKLTVASWKKDGKKVFYQVLENE